MVVDCISSVTSEIEMKQDAVHHLTNDGGGATDEQ